MTAANTDALSELARLWRRYEGDPEGALRIITETGCKALGVARCSVWVLDDDRDTLRCADLYDAAANSHSNGIELPASAYPGYFAALEAEEPIAADDAHTDPRTCEFSTGYLTPLGIGALLDAPIRSGLKLVGVVCHEHIGPMRPWTRGEQKDAAFLASLASLAMELGQRARREALLTATLESTGEGIVAFDGERVSAFNHRFLEMFGLTEPPTQVAALRAHLDRKTQAMARYLSDAGEIMATAVDDAVDVLELADGKVYERTSRPQILRDQVVGRVWSYRDVTGQRRAEAALRAGEARMRELAIRDGLTGLFNRRHAVEQLGAAITSALATGEKLAVGLLDVDYFKKINDTHGHLVGDAVLRDISRILGDRLRGTDLVGRYGGEEFVVIMRRADGEAARVVLDQVRRQLADRQLPEGIPGYTFSAGVAEFPTDGDDVTAMLARADERLYEAKRAGRDRVVEDRGMADDSVKRQLKKLRDDLAAETQRALTFAGAPRELAERVKDAAGHVGNVYLKCCAPQTGPTEILEELYDDALVEGHLALSDWREWIDHQQKRTPGQTAAAERRIHPRDPSTVSVKLIRHHVRGEGKDVVVDEQAVDRLTRDVSDGGVFVLARRQDLAQVTVGHVLHISLPGVADAPEQKARATVIRRDDFGIALRWVIESPLDRHVVDTIVRSIRTRPAPSKP